MICGKFFRVIYQSVQKEKTETLETLGKQSSCVKSGEILKPLLLLDPTHRRFFLNSRRN